MSRRGRVVYWSADTAPPASKCRLTALVLLLGIAVVGCGGSAKTAACVNGNPVNYEVTTAKVGQLVYVVHVESERYLSRAARRGGKARNPGFPNGFPWARPVSSNPNVLAPVVLCKEPGAITTLPVEVSAFRAVRPGTATLHTPLAARWQAIKLPPGGEVHADSRTITGTR